MALTEHGEPGVRVLCHRAVADGQAGPAPELPPVILPPGHQPQLQLGLRPLGQDPAVGIMELQPDGGGFGDAGTAHHHHLAARRHRRWAQLQDGCWEACGKVPWVQRDFGMGSSYRPAVPGTLR